ncbi:MAG: c-type cytochrome [Chloroflexi bacterium]|nr:c-type cytochrome [Chloroflexota bacterium]
MYRRAWRMNRTLAWRISFGIATALLFGLAVASAQAAPAAQVANGREVLAQVAAVGDPVQGKEYFSGIVPLANGGPPCMTCHSIAGLGALGGGAVGPDLTGAYAKYGGEVALGALLENIGFPTMRPVFSTHPLTPAERAALIAFLKDAPLQARSGDALLLLAGLGLLGGLAIAGLFHVVWRKRLAGVRKPMLGGVR